MFKRLVMFLSMIFIVSCFWNTKSSFAATTYQNPPYQDINKYLTEAALKYNIPPEVVKSIAFQESGWCQFQDGSPLVSTDGGIGIMQITNDPRFDQEKLKTDIEYNINAGVQKLDEKFRGIDGLLPIVNNNDRSLLESWYFAILAYNGRSISNSPLIQSDGSRNTSAYQEKIYNEMDLYNNTDLYPIPFDFKLDDFTFGSATNSKLLLFNKSNYYLENQLLHPSNYNWGPNDIILSSKGANFRKDPSTSSSILMSAPSGTREAITVMNNFQYDQSNVYDPSAKMLYKQYAWYKVKLPNGEEAYTATGDLKSLGKRLNGSDRFSTAIAISKEGWGNGANTVVLAKATDFPDALAGAPLAYSLNAPLLLTYQQKLPDVTKSEIKRLGAKTIILLGGTGAISDGVYKELLAMNLTVKRYGGSNRYETAKQIAANILNKANTAIVAYGYDFPDALSIAPYAAKNKIPIFLSATNSLPAVTSNALKGYKNTIVVGGEGVISKAVYSKLPNPVRYGGSTRYDTNAKIVTSLEMGTDKTFVATGLGFADALTGSVLAAKNNAYLLLTLPDQVPSSIQTAILNKKLDYFDILGGEAVVGVEDQLGTLIEK